MPDIEIGDTIYEESHYSVRKFTVMRLTPATLILSLNDDPTNREIIVNRNTMKRKGATGGRHTWGNYEVYRVADDEIAEKYDRMVFKAKIDGLKSEELTIDKIRRIMAIIEE